jgi:hypothetical protein
VLHEHLGDLRADAVDRVEARHRLLEYHADLLAAHAAHLSLGQVRELPSAEADRACGDVADAGREEAHDRERCHRLAGPALPHDRDRFSAVDGEADAVHRDDRAAPAEQEARLEVADLE